MVREENMRSIQSVLDELREEKHVPMVKFVEELKRQEWATRLGYDLSMLRLWISREDKGTVEVMVVYGDGRGGGRPSEPYGDAFETTFFVDSQPVEVSTGSSASTVARLCRWRESAE